VKLVVPTGTGSSFWFWLYVVDDGSAGNVQSCWHEELQVEVAYIAAPCAYQPVLP
jgi:hypothetical protein